MTQPLDDRTPSGRVALVTGASGGIGAALAARLAESGADLALAMLRNGYLTNKVVTLDGGLYPT